MPSQRPLLLGQAVAIHRDHAGRALRQLTDAHRLCGKPELFSGFNRRFVMYPQINSVVLNVSVERGVWAGCISFA